MPDLGSFALFAIGLVLGAGAVAWLARARARDLQAAIDAARADSREARDLASRLGAEAAALGAKLEHAATFRERALTLEREREKLAAEVSVAQQRVAELKAQLHAEIEKSAERVKLLADARERMRGEFQALAQQILEDKSKRFSEQNAQQLGALLDPMRTQLGEFKKTVTEVYDKESRERLLLKAEIEQIRGLNAKLSEDAHNLTKALKGDARVQGNWGELALERLLEASGLMRGRSTTLRSA
jgi:DNA recombination protein RmuC